MTDRYEFAYIECSIPEGLTIREWRKGLRTPHMSRWARFLGWFR